MNSAVDNVLRVRADCQIISKHRNLHSSTCVWWIIICHWLLAGCNTSHPLIQHPRIIVTNRPVPYGMRSLSAIHIYKWRRANGMDVIIPPSNSLHYRVGWQLVVAKYRSLSLQMTISTLTVLHCILGPNHYWAKQTHVIVDQYSSIMFFKQFICVFDVDSYNGCAVLGTCCSGCADNICPERPTRNATSHNSQHMLPSL